MMRHNIELVRRIIRFFYELLFTLLLLEFVTVIFFKDKVLIKNVLILAGFYLVSYIAREKSPNIFVMLLIHILPVIPLCIMHMDLKYLILFMLFMIFLMDASYMYMKKGMVLLPMTDFPWVIFLVSFIIYLYGYFTKSLDMIWGIYLIPALLIFLYLFGIYADGLKKYIVSTGDITGLPIKNIIITNTCMVGIVFVIILALFIISSQIDISVITGKIAYGLSAILRIIWAVISFVGAIIGSMITVGNSSIIENGSNYGEKIGAEAGNVAQFMEGFIQLALLGLLIYLIYRFAKYIFGIIFVRYRHESGEIEKIKAPVKKNIKRAKIRQNKIKKLDLEHIFRRQYMLYVLRHKADIELDASRTGRQIEADMTELEIKSAHEVTELYCDVRYGGSQVDRSTIKKIRKLTR